jgi:hypothetical protein
MPTYASYVAELLLHYLEDKKELLLRINETVTNATPSRKFMTIGDLWLVYLAL